LVLLDANLILDSAVSVDAAPTGTRDLTLWRIVLKGAGRGSQLAVNAVAVAVLGHAASLALPAGITGAEAAALSLPGVVLVVLGRDDFHLTEIVVMLLAAV
jgi:hypothetical protein